ncbi:hypothetical protein HNS40_21570, partial [Lentimicrobium sp. S6]
ATTEDLSGLSGGNFSVTVTDANGCTTTSGPHSVSEPSVLAVIGTETNILCFGESTGAIDVTTSGGTTDYTYLWSNAATTEDISSLAAGTYTISVTDANGCTTSDSWTIAEPAAALSVTLSSSTMVDCNGSATGELTAAVAGGTPAYTYLWSNSATTAGITGLLAGDYTVSVTDNNGCTTSDTYTVTEPTVLDFTSFVTDVSCNGLSDGEIEINATGGTGAYEYRIKLQSEATWTQPWQPSSTFSGLASETYRVRVRDANGCTITKTVTVDEPDVLAVSLNTQTNVSCNGANDGAIDVDVTGGNSPYTYLWDNGATTEDITGLTPGTYTLTVDDNLGCGPVVSATYTITEPDVLDFTFTTTDVDCNGAANGEIEVSATGGTAPYEYRIKLQSGTWDEAWQSSNIFSNLDGEVYRVRVRDANGCLITKTVTIDEPTALDITLVDADDITCFGSGDGYIDLTVSGGTVSYTYSWSSTAAGFVDPETEDLSGLEAGDYTLEVTDSNGCDLTSSVYTISEPAELDNTSVRNQNVTCFGGTDGIIDLAATGGITDYTFTIAPVAGSLVGTQFVNLPANSYTVTVTDSNGCDDDEVVFIGQPEPFTYVVTPTDATCNGGADGSIEVKVEGGNSGPTEISIDNGSTYETGVWNGVDFYVYTFTGLTAGTYNVSVMDTEGCTGDYDNGGGSNAVVIGEPTAITYDFVGEQPVVPCFGDQNGEIQILVSGGTPGYEYSIDGGVTYQASNVFDNLFAGFYEIWVKDAAGCEVAYPLNDFEVTERPEVQIDDVFVTDVTCFGGSDGELEIIASGGFGAFEYSIDGNPYQTSNIFTGLTQGDHTILVKDSDGCTIDPAETYTVGVGDDIDPVAVCNPITVELDATGNYMLTSLDIDAIGLGSSDNCAIATMAVLPNSFTCTDAGPNTVTLTITDSNGNDATCMTTVTVNDNIAPVAVCNPITVELDATGNYMLTSTDIDAIGLGSYDNCAIATMTVLPNSFTCADAGPNTVTLTITDSNGNDATCMTTVTVNDNIAPVAVCNPITVELDATGNYMLTSTDIDAIGLGSSDNCAIVTMTVLPNSFTCADAGPNTVTLTVTDSNGNDATCMTTVTVNDVTAPVIAGSLLDSNIEGCDVTASPAETTVAALEALAGDLTITDACSASADITISNIDVVTGSCPMMITRTYSATDESSNTSVDFVHVLYVNDTQAPVVAGAIDETVLEGCDASAAPAAEATVAGIEALAGGLTITDVCTNDADIIVSSVDVEVGTCPIVITRTYTVTDECGNFDSFDHVIKIDDTFTLDVTSTDVVCNGDDNGTITVVATDAVCDLTYSIDGTDYSNTDGIFTGLIPGTYPVSVMNIHGCVTSWPTDIVIGEPDVLVVDNVVTSNVTGCEGDENATITVIVSGGTPAYMYSIDNATTWQASNLFEDLAAGDYDIYVKDANDCISGWGITIHVNEPAPIVIALDGITNVDCFGNSTGSVHMTVSGGTPDFSYEWVGPDGFTADTESINGLLPGDYVLTVTDANDCVEISGPHTVTEPLSALVIDEVLVTDVSICAGNMNASIEIAASGGTPNYLYSIDNGGSYFVNPVFEELGAGVYEILVRDANGCETVLEESITITQPDAIDIVSVDVVNVMGCFGDASGEIHINATGGTGILRYSIDNGDTYLINGGVFTGLAAGTYQVKVKDNNGCRVLYDMPTVITEPALLEVVEVILTDVSGCYGNTNGMIEVAA